MTATQYKCKITTDMLTVALITAHGRQCKAVGLHLQFRRMGIEIQMVLSSDSHKKTKTNVPDIPHTLFSNFIRNVSILKQCQLLP